MHIPLSFQENDPNKLLQIMQDNAFASLITSNEGRPIATSLPFIIKRTENNILLQAHFAKNNPQWQHLENSPQVLVVFQGPHCYISPSWYKNSGVPTWNYVTVHAYGSARIFDSEKETAKLIEELSDKYESAQKKPWKATNNYSNKLLDHIVGFEINVQELQGKVKISQNKSGEDLIGVIKALKKSTSEQERAIAALMENYLKSKD